MKKNKGYSVSMRDNTHKKAKEKAKKLGLTLSGYITYLINKDEE